MGYLANAVSGIRFIASLFLCAGESGLGKSTLINSLFLTDLYKDRKVPNAEGEITSILFLLQKK